MTLRFSALWFAPALLGLAGTAAHADTSSLRAYFDGLPPAAYPVQTAGNLWTFHAGDADGVLMAPSFDAYVNGFAQQIGSLVPTGEFGCSPGLCPITPASTLATFDGVFVHPGHSVPTTAVFHVQQDLVLDSIRLWSETVGNASNGNGLTVAVLATVGGQTQGLGGFVFDYPGTLAAKDEHLYSPALTLHAGDRIEFRYGNNGAWDYDHGNIEIRLDSHALTAAVPEPAGWMLFLAGLMAVPLARRRSKGE